MSRRGIVGAAQLRKSIDRLGLLQIDSVNVLVRAQYLPLFSRLGSYDTAALDALVATKPKRFFEHWGHEASLLPIDCQPLLRWRMARAPARMAATGLFAQGRTCRPQDPRFGAALALRPAYLAASANRKTVRVPIPPRIYTPARTREHGYYVLPFLLDGALVARVDLKADRKVGTLIVQRAHVEPGAPQ